MVKMYAGTSEQLQVYCEEIGAMTRLRYCSLRGSSDSGTAGAVDGGSSRSGPCQSSPSGPACVTCACVRVCVVYTCIISNYITVSLESDIYDIKDSFRSDLNKCISKAPEIRTPHYTGQNDRSQCCPLKRGSTVVLKKDVSSQSPPDQHVSELGKLAVFLVLHLNEAPLGLTAEHLLTAHRHLTIAADYCKRNVLLEEREGRWKEGREGRWEGGKVGGREGGKVGGREGRWKGGRRGRGGGRKGGKVEGEGEKGKEGTYVGGREGRWKGREEREGGKGGEV